MNAYLVASMPSFEQGIRRALLEFVSFFVIGVLLGAVFALLGLLYIASLIYLLMCLFSLADLDKMKYWSTSYLVGYLLAQIMIMSVFPDITSMLSIFAGLMILARRIVKRVFTLILRL